MWTRIYWGSLSQQSHQPTFMFTNTTQTLACWIIHLRLSHSMDLVRCCAVLGTSILFKKCHILLGNDVDLSEESVSTTPPLATDIHVYEQDTNMHDASPFESFTAMLNCGNESTASGESFIQLHIHVFHLPKPLSQSVS